MINKALRWTASKAAAIGQSGVITGVAQSAMPLEQTQFELPEDEPTSAPWFEAHPQSPVFFDLDDDVEPVTVADEDSHREIQPADAESPEAQAVESPWYTAAQLAGGNPDHDKHGVSNRGEQLETRDEREDEHELASLSASVTQVDEPGERTGLIGETSADPWDDPLPAWDYSRNEWPVLLGPSQQSSDTRHRTIFAALALVVLAALIYFLIFRPGSPRQLATAAANSSAQDSAAAGELPAPAAEPAAVDEPRASAAEPAAEQNGTAPSASQDPKAEQTGAAAASNESDNDAGANGRFSLQAAAFPTEEGAGQFAEKLKRAGVPSYIVAADIARRGRWFRVRVGRFNSAADAGRFAAEAQMRAGSAGLSLQLITCQYEQP